MSSYKTFTKLSQRLSGQWVKNCQANITPSCRGGEEGGRWKQLGATSAPRSMMLCTDLCTVRSAYPAYSPAKLKPAPVGQLCVRWYFAITLMAVGLIAWETSWSKSCAVGQEATGSDLGEAASPFLLIPGLLIRAFSGLLYIWRSTDYSLLRFLEPTPSISAVVEKFCRSPCSPKLHSYSTVPET